MSANSIRLPIAEIFTSVHGEGQFVGTPMTFIRLAGCTVGKMFKNNGPAPVDFPQFPDGHHNFVCTTFDGRTFPCDTDYRKTQVLTVEEIIEQIPFHIKHVCITGGEPLMHVERIEESKLLFRLLELECMIHFETSGTILPPKFWADNHRFGDFYFACSPKANFLPMFIEEWADEVRLMVDKDFNLNQAMFSFSHLGIKTPLYLCPLSSPHNVSEFDPESLAKCLSLLKEFPSARISIQQHKVLNVR